MENIKTNEKDFLSCIESSKKIIANIPAEFNFSDSAISSKFGDTADIDKGFPELIKIGEFIPQKYLNENNPNFNIPALIPLSRFNGICFYVNNINKDEIRNLKQIIILRLLTCLPPDRVKLTCIYSESFIKDFPFLNSINPQYIENKKLSYSDDTDKVLAKLNELSIEFNNILQKNNLKNIDEYNKKFPQQIYPYRFVIINNFPSGFTKESAQILLNLLKNVANTGIHIIMSLDIGIKSPYNSELLEKLLSLMIGVYQEKGKYFKLKNLGGNEKIFNEKFNMNLDTKVPDNIEHIIKTINSHFKTEPDNISQNSLKKNDFAKDLKVDISELLPEEHWSGNSSEGIKIPIGKLENNEIKYLILGQDKEHSHFGVHHAMITGITGSGKTTLLHNIINISSYIYSPEELQFFLLDYKEGTEFKVYKALPHVKFLSVTSERNFGVKLLEQLTAEIESRGKLFHLYENVSDIVSYRKVSGKILPRLIVIINDFQILINEKDAISEKVKSLLDHILRVGRSFGVNIILSTQSISGVDLAKLSNIGLKIALKMSEADSTTALSKDNTAASFLARPGEAIYNTQNGLTEGNIKFVFPFLNSEKVSLLLEKHNNENKTDLQIIQPELQENSLARIEDNQDLFDRIKSDSFIINDDFCDIFIGNSVFNSEKHIFYRLRRQIESNMVMIGRSSELAVKLFNISLFQIIKQSTPESKFYVLDLFDVDSTFKGSFESLKDITKNCYIGETRNIDSFFNEILAELGLRLKDEKSKNRIILSIANLQNSRKRLGQYSSLDAGQKLMKIISEGPEVGIHTIIYSQDYNTFENLIDTKFINEFENRIAFSGGEEILESNNYTSLDISDNTGLLESPYSKDETEKFNIYEFESLTEITKDE